MTKRVAALFALVAFATAWLVGVGCGHSPLTRLENAAIALVAGFLAGLGIGVALERIVLARLAEEWRERQELAPASEPARARRPEGEGATSPDDEPAVVPSVVEAKR